MISLGEKFSDYGFTGGLFLCGQAALVALLSPDAFDSSSRRLFKVVGVSFEHLSEGLKPIGISVAIALLILVIFALGLTLDLLGSLLLPWEANIFKKYLGRNEAWIRSLLASHRLFLVDDLDFFIEKLGPPLGMIQEWKKFLRVSPLWKIKVLANMAKDLIMRDITQFRLWQPYARLQSILFFHLVINVEASRLQTLHDQHRVYRVSRAVGTGLHLLGLEGALLLSQKFPFPSVSQMTILALGGVAWVSIAIFFTTRPYSRFCLSLFTCLFLVTKNLQDLTIGQDTIQSPTPEDREM